MADRRTTITIDVVGLADLQAANTAMSRHATLVQKLTAAYQGLNAITSSVGTGMVNVNNTFNNSNTTINNTANTVNKFAVALNGANDRGRNMLGTLLQYRALGAVFEGVSKGIQATATALYEMEKQAARVSRVSGGEAPAIIRAGFAEEAARTGASIQDIGEAYYQIKTQVKDADTAFAAIQTTMNLVVGTQSDARDTARAMLQIYNQFGDQLDKSASKAENFRRIGELLAGTFKGADAEMNDITASLKYLGPIADAAGLKVEQVMGTISALTAQGQRGRMSGTEAGQFIANLIKNYDAEIGGIQKKGLVYHFELAKNDSGGIDLLGTIRNIVDAANRLPADKAREFLLAVSGSQNSFRFLGTTGAEFMQHLTDAIKRAGDEMRGRTGDAERMRVQMTTTAQEFQRSWTGAITAVANMIDASGLKGFFHGLADDLQRFNETTLHMQQSNSRLGDILNGGGQFPGDPTAARTQMMARRAALQEMLIGARERGVSGVAGGVTDVMGMGGVPQADPGNLNPLTQSITATSLYNNIYRMMPPAQRGYVQQFMQFQNQPFTANRAVTMDLPAMQREYDRLNAQLNATRSSAPLSRADVPATSTLGLRGLTATQAENAAIITAAAKKYGVDPLAMIAVAHYESGLSATSRNATSSATGLFQILSGTAPGINRADPFQNAQFAARSIAAAGGRGLTGEDAIRLIVERFERPGATATPAEEASANKFYANRGIIGRSGKPPITKSQEAIDREREQARREADEAERVADAARKERERIAKEAADEHAAATEYYAGLAQSKYGVNSPMALQRAMEAQRAAEEAAADGRRRIVLSESQADSIATDPRFNTVLSSTQEAQFQAWKRKYAPKDSGYDYDLRGAFLSGFTPDPKTGHWQDTYKKPNHPTFSDQSMYAKDMPGLAGHWAGETYVPQMELYGGIDLQKLKEHFTGPLADYFKAVKDAAEKAADAARDLYSKGGAAGQVVGTSLFPFPQDAIDAFQNRPQTLKAIKDYQDAKKYAEALQALNVSSILTGADTSIAALNRTARPNALFGGADERQRSILQGTVTTIQQAIDALKQIKAPTDETARQLKDMSEKLLDANAALTDFGDQMAQKAAAKLFSDVTDKYQRQLSDLDNKNLPGVGESPRQAEGRERNLLLNKLDFANRQFSEVSGLASFTTGFLFGGEQPQSVKKDIENADIARKQAQLALTQFDRQQAISRYDAVHGPLAQQAQGYAMQFLHGQGSPADLFKGLGGSIVDAALTPWTKKLTDPLVNVTTKQVLELQNNTKALGLLNDSMTGTGPGTLVDTVKTNGGDLGGVIVAGLGLGAILAGGAGSAGSKKPGGGSHAGSSKASAAHQTDLEKGLSAGLAAYSIFSTGQQQGVNAGNVLGGVLSGASIGSTFGPAGGLIGGAVGGIVDLIGGLFHQRSKPTATPQDLNPAFYNAPAGFDVAAYNYSAYGKLPTMQDVGFDVKAAKTPIVQVFVDGARVAAKQEIAAQSSSVSVSLANTTMDRYKPI